MRTQCIIDNCTGLKVQHGLCNKHRLRLNRYGDVNHTKINAKGTGSLGNHGYRTVWAPGHPMAMKDNRALEHRYLMFNALGEGPHKCHWCPALLEWPEITIDHLNWNRTDNRLDNLVISCGPCNIKRQEPKKP